MKIISTEPALKKNGGGWYLRSKLNGWFWNPTNSCFQFQPWDFFHNEEEAKVMAKLEKRRCPHTALILEVVYL